MGIAKPSDNYVKIMSNNTLVLQLSKIPTIVEK